MASITTNSLVGGAVKKGAAGGKKSKIMPFHTNEAKEFMADKHEFLGFTFFKKVEINVFIPNECSEEALTVVHSTIMNGIDGIFNTMKVPDMIAFELNPDEFKLGKVNAVFTANIPFSGKMDIVIQTIKRVVNNTIKPGLESMNFDLSLRIKDMVRIGVNAGLEHQANSKIFLKGFTAISHEDPRVNRETGEQIGNPKDYIKTGIYVADWAGWKLRDVITFNRFSLNMAKIMVSKADDTVEQSSYEYWIPYKKNLKIITYQFESGDAKNPKFLVHTTTLSINVVKNSIMNGQKKILAGISCNRKFFNGYVSGIEEAITNRDGVNILTIGSGADEKGRDMDTYMADVNTIDSVLFAGITKVPDEEEETVVKEEEKEPTFNDVGTLSDVVSEEVSEDPAEYEADNVEDEAEDVCEDDEIEDSDEETDEDLDPDPNESEVSGDETEDSEPSVTVEP